MRFQNTQAKCLQNGKTFWSLSAAIDLDLDLDPVHDAW